MFPIRDHNPSGSVPIVTYCLVAANVGIFLSYWLTLPNDYAQSLFFYTWGLVPGRVMSGQGWEGFLTSMFLHGGWLHLAGNMLFLWIFGDNLEDVMGHFGFALFYLMSGVAASGLQIAADPFSGIPMVGASGAIAGVMGGYLLLFPRAKVDVLFIFIIIFKVFPIRAWIVLSLWFAMQIFGGFNTPSDGGGVAYWAHAGGFLGGIALTLIPWLKRGGPAFWSRTHGLPPHPPAPDLLAKSRIPSVRR